MSSRAVAPTGITPELLLEVFDLPVTFHRCLVPITGGVNIYSSRHYDTDLALYEDFTKQTGIKINRIEAKEDELLERIRTEGANSPADIFG